MARNKIIDPSKERLVSPLLKYRITRHGQDPIYAEANEVNSYGRILELSHRYTNGYNLVVCAFGVEEWEKIELVEAFPEET